MNRLLALFVSCFLTTICNGQWQGTNPVWFTSGNVGVGTNDPWYNFHLVGTFGLGKFSNDNHAGLTVDYTDGGSGTTIFKHLRWGGDFYFKRNDASGEKTQLHFGGAANHYMDIYDNNNQINVRLNTSGDSFFNGGKVGIGTTSPQSKVDVATSSLTALSISGNNSNYTGPDINITRSNSSPNVGNAPALQFNDPNSSSYYIIQGSTGGLQFFNYSNSSWIERMRMDQLGRVGIGTTTPTYSLDVNGTGRFNSLLDVGPARNPNSAAAGLNVYDPEGGPWTNMQFAQRSWGGSHAILFNAYKTNSVVNGDLAALGNTKYSNDVGPFSTGAGMIHFGANTGYMDFFISPNSTGKDTNVDWQTPILSLRRGGNVGIGTASPDAKLAVKGQVHAQEVKVDLNGAVAPDYVFEKDYKLTPLEEIKNYIEQNKHLPEVPSAKEMEKNGVQLGEMNMLLLKKIEELTLYVIDQGKMIEELGRKTVAQQNEIDALKKTK